MHRYINSNSYSTVQLYLEKNECKCAFVCTTGLAAKWRKSFLSISAVSTGAPEITIL